MLGETLDRCVCGGKMSVTNTRQLKGVVIKHRIRVCRECERKEHTYEVAREVWDRTQKKLSEAHSLVEHLNNVCRMYMED